MRTEAQFGLGEALGQSPHGGGEAGLLARDEHVRVHCSHCAQVGSVVPEAEVAVGEEAVFADEPGADLVEQEVQRCLVVSSPGCEGSFGGV